MLKGDSESPVSPMPKKEVDPALLKIEGGVKALNLTHRPKVVVCNSAKTPDFLNPLTLMEPS
jgi:hypothetical protein